MVKNVVVALLCMLMVFSLYNPNVYSISIWNVLNCTCCDALGRQKKLCSFGGSVHEPGGACITSSGRDRLRGYQSINMV